MEKIKQKTKESSVENFSTHWYRFCALFQLLLSPCTTREEKEGKTQHFADGQEKIKGKMPYRYHRKMKQKSDRLC